VECREYDWESQAINAEFTVYSRSQPGMRMGMKILHKKIDKKIYKIKYAK
jgi:hypothetical protein